MIVMSLASEQDIEEFADQVRSTLGDRVEEVILFGSYARDDYVPGSDIDVMVLVSEEKEGDEEKVWSLADEFMVEKDLQFSPKIYLKSDFEEKVDQDYSFYQEVAGEGVEI